MARFDDFDDPLGVLEPLLDAAASARSDEQRRMVFADIDKRLTCHFDSVEPTLYAALRPFAQVSHSLGHAERARDEISLGLTTLSRLPSDSEAWPDMFHGVEEAVRHYFEYIEPRLIEAAALCLGGDALRRLGLEAERLHAERHTRSRDHVRTLPVHQSEPHHG